VSILTRTVPLRTNGDGDASATVRAGGCRLLAVDFSLGTMAAADLTITDEPSGRQLLAVPDIEADAFYQPMVIGQNTDGSDVSSLGGHVIPVVLGRIEIAIANGGDTLTGEVTLVLER
jgi:hypothetical protein